MLEFKNSKGEIILYNGNPNLLFLDKLSCEDGDVWHSSFEQGFKNIFQDIVYQSPTFWFVNDFENLDKCISWRINPRQFAIRKSVWQQLDGFDKDYKNPTMAALDFGYRLLRFCGGIPLYAKGLFTDNCSEIIAISKADRYLFYIKNFKISHALIVLFRRGVWNISEWYALSITAKNFKKRKHNCFVAKRALEPLCGKPSISYIIPTMMRQKFTIQLLNDLKSQTLLPTEVIIVDATPEIERDYSLYNFSDFPFEVKLFWQTSKGSCRARNEAIAECTGEYIVFGDDDVRFFPDFIENHIRFLSTYNLGACNGLDIQADNVYQDLHDLRNKLNTLSEDRKITGAAMSFSNANSCVKREFVNKLVGNDINFDGGYGEDSDFGLSLFKIGVMVMYNPYSANLHLKPLLGGYRFWGKQAAVMGKKRKSQPWELDIPVQKIRPVPSPTIMYGILKQCTRQQQIEYKYNHFFHYLFKGSKIGIPYRLLRIPYKNSQFKKSVFYAKNLIKLGIRHH